jgi:outer membrane protein assembly factor BamB
MRRVAAVVSMVVLSCAAAEWPQWLGPNRDGSSPESVKPWNGPLKPAWTQAVGEGHSSPVIASARVFLHYKVAGKEVEEVAAFDLADGKEMWRKSYERPKFESIFGNGPRATPLVDGDRLYTFGASGILCCWACADGKLHWQKDMLKEFKAKNLFFGTSSSPVIDGDQLIVMVGGEEATVVALNKIDGKPLWTSLLRWPDKPDQPKLDHASYSSPIVTDVGKVRAAVLLTGEGVVALSVADGKPLWQHPFRDKLNESSTTPVRVGDLIFVSSVTIGSAGLKLVEKEGKPSVVAEWTEPKDCCYFSTPVVLGDHLYVVYCAGALLNPTANLHCVDPRNGKTLWKKDKVGVYHASLLAAKDRLLMLEEKGDLVLIQPDAKEFKELARAKVCGKTWAHPALSGGRLVVRDEKQLICVPLQNK